MAKCFFLFLTNLQQITSSNSGLQLGGHEDKASLAAILFPLKFSELLFILLYLVYFCPQTYVCPLSFKIFLPHHGMFSTCGAAPTN